MAKAQSGSPIDFANLTPDQLEKMKKVVKIISEYDGEIAAINDSKKATTDDLVLNLDADKDSVKKLKKYIKIAAKVRTNGGGEVIRDDNTAIERLLIALGELTN